MVQRPPMRPVRRRRLGPPRGGGSPGSRSSPREEGRKERAQAEAFREKYYAQVGGAGQPAARVAGASGITSARWTASQQRRRWWQAVLAACLLALLSEGAPLYTLSGQALQGVSYGKPAACIMFDLAYHLGQENAHMLWLALVGLTDHLVHGRIAGGSRRRAMPHAARRGEVGGRAACPATKGWLGSGRHKLGALRPSVREAGCVDAAVTACLTIGQGALAALRAAPTAPFCLRARPAPQATSTWATTCTTRRTSAVRATWTCRWGPGLGRCPGCLHPALARRAASAGNLQPAGPRPGRFLEKWAMPARVALQQQVLRGCPARRSCC